MNKYIFVYVAVAVSTALGFHAMSAEGESLGSPTPSVSEDYDDTVGGRFSNFYSSASKTAPPKINLHRAEAILFFHSNLFPRSQSLSHI